MRVRILPSGFLCLPSTLVFIFIVLAGASSEQNFAVTLQGRFVQLHLPPAGSSFLFDLPKREREAVADGAVVHIQVEEVTVGSRETEIKGRRVYFYQNEDGEVKGFTDAAASYRLRWRGAAPTEHEIDIALAQVFRPLVEHPRDWKNFWAPGFCPPSEMFRIELLEPVGATPPSCKDWIPERIQETSQPSPVGETVIEVEIDTAGRVTAFDLVSSPDARTGERLRSTLSSWRFKPAKKDGEPVRARVRLVLERKDSVLAEPTPEVAPGIYRIGSGISAPVCLRCRDPEYPRALRPQQVDGHVLLGLIVGKNGHVYGVRLVRSSGHLVMDGETARAVTDWKFRPSQLNGKPVDLLMLIEVNFESF